MLHWVLAVAVILRLGIGALLVVAGCGKALLGRTSTRRLVSSYRIVPERLSGSVAVALPTVEIGVGAALFLGVWMPVTGVLAFGLLTVVTVAAALAAARRLAPTCGCFGAAFETAISPPVLVRNSILLVALGLLVAVAGRMPLTADATGLTPLVTAPAVGLGAVAAAEFLFRRVGDGR